MFQNTSKSTFPTPSSLPSKLDVAKMSKIEPVSLKSEKSNLMENKHNHIPHFDNPRPSDSNDGPNKKKKIGDEQFMELLNEQPIPSLLNNPAISTSPSKSSTRTNHLNDAPLALKKVYFGTRECLGDRFDRGPVGDKRQFAFMYYSSGQNSFCRAYVYIDYILKHGFKYCPNRSEIYIRPEQFGAVSNEFYPDDNNWVTLMFENKSTQFENVVNSIFIQYPELKDVSERITDDSYAPTIVKPLKKTPTKTDLSVSNERYYSPQIDQPQLPPKGYSTNSPARKKPSSNTNTTPTTPKKIKPKIGEDEDDEYKPGPEDLDKDSPTHRPTTRKPPAPPVEEKFLFLFHGIRITQADVARLSPGEFLNDNIIDFFIQSEFEKNPEYHEKFLVYNTHFWPLLKRDPTRAAERIPKKGTKIYDKKALFIPINEHYHWTMCVVVNPGNFDLPKEEQKEDEKAMILYFDSLGGKTHFQPFRRIREYLSTRWKVETGKTIVHNGETIPGKVPSLPNQPNSFDCGVYLLHYLDLFLKTPPKTDELDNLKGWFDIEDIPKKRERIKAMLNCSFDTAPEENKIDRLGQPDTGGDESSQPEIIITDKTVQ